MEVCVPKELKWSEQVKKVWTDRYLCGIKPNTWLHSQGCRGWGHHGSSSGTCVVWDCSTAASRKKGESAERLGEHDLRSAGIRIVEWFLVSFGRAVALWLICQWFVTHSWSLCFPVTVRVVIGHSLWAPDRPPFTGRRWGLSQQSRGTIASCCSWGQKASATNMRTSLVS